MDPVKCVRDALTAGKLTLETLTARKLGAFLGKTTSVLYHHWGSLDGFLFEVALAGMSDLYQQLLAQLEHGDVAELAADFVRAGLDNPDLYTLMFERRYDWEALRQRGYCEPSTPGLKLWGGLIAFLEANGVEDAAGDARLLFAGLHGLVSLASSGRANIGELATSDRDIAITSARELARRLCPSACRAAREAP